MGREDDFLAVAVVRYVDSCPPGTLHPDCPFAAEVAGRRSCHRECRDVVTRVLRPGGPEPVHRRDAYDARQLLLSEAGPVPDATWQTASLLMRLQAALRYPPYGRSKYLIRRHIDVTNAVAYLAQRGFDPDWVVRHVMAGAIRSGLRLWLSRLYREREFDGGAAASSGVVPSGAEEWLSVFASHMGALGAQARRGELMAEAISAGFDHHVDRWLDSAPLEDVVEWRYSSPSQSVGSDPGRVAEAAWILDRFATTYLRQWATASLHQEFKYLSGEVTPPIPRGQMALREVDPVSLNGEIARRATQEQSADQSLWKVTLLAVDLLTEGRREEAAALFDSARILTPDSADAHNNYGFCTLLDDPESALVSLRRAAELGKADHLNSANQALALWLLGRDDEALRVADESFEAHGRGSASGWLWNVFDDPNEPQMEEYHPTRYLCLLGRFVSEQSGRSEEAIKWNERLLRQASGAA